MPSTCFALLGLAADTTVIYFVRPTQSNVDRICKDLQEDLYDKCQLNFLSAVPTDLLEQLAMTTVSSQTSCEVERVYDMYTNFISLEVRQDAQLLTSLACVWVQGEGDDRACTFFLMRVRLLCSRVLSYLS